MSSLKKFAADETGATAVEYALMVALIALVIFGVVQYVGDAIKAAFCSVLKVLGGSCT
ncbi:MAG: Flp family type IVb pilin [Burkholderiales bacterium]|nr:Flp family type IVb pilin [Burkholderiales bacterium]